METKVFLFVRKTGVDGTNIIEVDIKEAMKFIKENRKNKDGFQIGILSGNSYDDILDVYGEYAPLKKVKSLEELNSIVSGKDITFRALNKERAKKFLDAFANNRREELKFDLKLVSVKFSPQEIATFGQLLNLTKLGSTKLDFDIEEIMNENYLNTMAGQRQYYNPLELKKAR